MSRPSGKAVVLLSGGLDSEVALYWSQSQGFQPQAVTFDFADRPRREREATLKIATAAKVELISLDLPFLSTSGRRNGALADGYIPMRNLIFFSIAGHVAERSGAGAIISGQVRGDNIDFPDATGVFFKELNLLLNFGLNAKPVGILRPFAEMTKKEVCDLGRSLGAPLELSWSCWRNGDAPCGRCASCIEREEALGSRV